MILKLGELRKRILELIQGLTSKAKDMEQESSSGLMEKNLKGSGDQARNRVMEFGNLQKETFTRVSGKTTNKMVKGHTSMQEDQNILATSKTSSSTDEANNNLQTETNIKESIGRVNLMATVNIFGKTVMYTKEISTTVLVLVKVF